MVIEPLLPLLLLLLSIEKFESVSRLMVYVGCLISAQFVVLYFASCLCCFRFANHEFEGVFGEELSETEPAQESRGRPALWRTKVFRMRLVGFY